MSTGLIDPTSHKIIACGSSTERSVYDEEIAHALKVAGAWWFRESLKPRRLYGNDAHTIKIVSGIELKMAKFLIQNSDNPTLQKGVLIPLCVFLIDCNGHKTHHILMDTAEKDAFTAILGDDERLSEPSSIRNIIYTILDALSFLHDAGYAMNDLKAENLVFFPNDPNIKIIDFGLVWKRKSHDSRFWKGESVNNGTRITQAPEYWEDWPLIDEEREHVDGRDFWSLGLFIYEILFGERLLLHVENDEIIWCLSQATDDCPAFAKWKYDNKLPHEYKEEDSDLQQCYERVKNDEDLQFVYDVMRDCLIVDRTERRNALHGIVKDMEL